MVNIIEDEVWNPEPALRPEDEIILRKLHDMLQSTADDLKLLSGELSKFHEPGVQVKTLPTPLDEEFNEKVHIEEVVNAKFHGYTIVDKLSPVTLKKNDSIGVKSVNKQRTNSSVQMNSQLLVKNPVISRNLAISRTKVLQIDEKIDEGTKSKLNNGKVIDTMPAVGYNEFTFKYVEPKVAKSPQKNLNVQQMPSINIRGELKEQKVVQLDIIPNLKEIGKSIASKSNVAVIAVEHETTTMSKQLHKTVPPSIIYDQKHIKPVSSEKLPVRKTLKMSTCDSSGSNNNISSDTQHKLHTQRQINSVLKTSPKTSSRIDRNKKSSINKELEKRNRLNLDEWKKKLNTVYGQPTSSSSRNKKNSTKLTIRKDSPKKSNKPKDKVTKPVPKPMNNVEYIPYSQLTLGGVRVSDIEREISDIPNNRDIPLSPILDKILSSRENSFQNDTPRKNKRDDSQKFLNTSDEKLLEEVLDIEKTVKKTVSKILKKKKNGSSDKIQNLSSESNEAIENQSYADDFEDEKSDLTELTENKNKSSSESAGKASSSEKSDNNDADDNDDGDDSNNPNPDLIQNTTFTKISNLSFKNSVDVFEFVHEVDTQDTATQSNTTDKIMPKETQTSPRSSDRQNIQPIHNDLWPSIDPKGEVEKMFRLEKDFIKKLILDEYGDLIEKNLNKPSTSKQNSQNQNVSAFQKNTQTSPAHVKCVMTSPTRTKTRTTSPFISLTVDNQTSPMIVVTNEEELNLEVDNDDLGISINLSSPRFSLRLPQTSKEFFSNLEDCSRTPSKRDDKDNRSKSKTIRKPVSSSSSVDADNSSSEISSLGEVKLKLKKKLRKIRLQTKMSESSSTSTVSKYSSDSQSCGVIPLRSEGEISLGQTNKKVINKTSRSEGETSLVQIMKW